MLIVFVWNVPGEIKCIFIICDFIVLIVVFVLSLIATTLSISFGIWSEKACETSDWDKGKDKPDGFGTGSSNNDRFIGNLSAFTNFDEPIEKIIPKVDNNTITSIINELPSLVS